MKRSIITPLCVFLFGMTCFAQGDRIVDLTYAFSSETVYWPNAKGFSFAVDAVGVTEKGYYYAANSFAGAEHGGTHIDAPIHFSEGMPTVDQLSLERLIAPGVLIDVRSQTEHDPNYLISVQDLLNWERANGQIPNGVILLFRTGWGRYYPHKKEYLGTDEKGSEAISKLRFPGLDPAAARWLVMNRSVAAVGIDTASIDYGKSELFESHQILFKKGIPAFENVANLDRLPDAGFQIIALPMKIAGGSGGPLRIVAILDD